MTRSPTRFASKMPADGHNFSAKNPVRQPTRQTRQRPPSHHAPIFRRKIVRRYPTLASIHSRPSGPGTRLTRSSAFFRAADSNLLYWPRCREHRIRIPHLIRQTLNSSAYPLRGLQITITKRQAEVNVHKRFPRANPRCLPHQQAVGRPRLQRARLPINQCPGMRFLSVCPILLSATKPDAASDQCDTHRSQPTTKPDSDPAFASGAANRIKVPVPKPAPPANMSQRQRERFQLVRCKAPAQFEPHGRMRITPRRIGMQGPRGIDCPAARTFAERDHDA